MWLSADLAPPRDEGRRGTWGRHRGRSVVLGRHLGSNLPLTRPGVEGDTPSVRPTGLYYHFNHAFMYYNIIIVCDETNVMKHNNVENALRYLQLIFSFGLTTYIFNIRHYGSDNWTYCNVKSHFLN